MNPTKFHHPPPLRVFSTVGPLLYLALSLFGPFFARATKAEVLPGYEAVRLGRGHYNRLHLAATIDGVKGVMLLDTGANFTVLNATSYRQLAGGNKVALPPGAPKQVTVNGVPTKLVMAPDFRVGSANLGSLPVALLARQYFYEHTVFDGASAGSAHDGIMGENLLRHYNAVVDCGRLILYLNTAPAKRLDFSRGFTSGGWTRVPMSNLRNDFTVACSLNGRRFRLIVDTGAPFTNLDRKLVDTLSVSTRDTPLRGALVGMTAQNVGLVNVSYLQIGSYVATNIHMVTSPLPMEKFEETHGASPDGPVAGLLGGDALADNEAVIDIGNKALYLKHGGRNQLATAR